MVQFFKSNWIFIEMKSLKIFKGWPEELFGLKSQYVLSPNGHTSRKSINVLGKQLSTGNNRWIDNHLLEKSNSYETNFQLISIFDWLGFWRNQLLFEIICFFYLF